MTNDPEQDHQDLLLACKLKLASIESYALELSSRLTTIAKKAKAERLAPRDRATKQELERLALIEIALTEAYNILVPPDRVLPPDPPNPTAGQSESTNPK